MITSFKIAREYIKADLEKINGGFTVIKLIKTLMFEPGFKYIFWMRLTQFYWLKGGLYLPLYAFCRFFLKHYSYKFSFDISYRAEIGPGFSISHHGLLIIRAGCKIGKNCWMRPGTCIGKKGVVDDNFGAIIGDDVHIGFGVGIFGNIHIGNNVSIGANSVVIRDIPDNCVVAGVPAHIIKEYK